MDVKVQAHGGKVSENLRNHILQRIEKLDRYDSQVLDAKFELRTERVRSQGERHIAQFTVTVPGRILRSEVRELDERAAVDQAVDKMARQMKRHYDRKKDRTRQNAVNLGRLAADQAEELIEEQIEQEDGVRVVRTKRFELQPMDADEAIEQMELLDHDFFVYIDRENGDTSVVYRRTDGAYGVIQPDTA